MSKKNTLEELHSVLRIYKNYVLVSIHSFSIYCLSLSTQGLRKYQSRVKSCIKTVAPMLQIDLTGSVKKGDTNLVGTIGIFHK